MFLDEITEFVNSKDNSCIILLSEYRPDIARAIAATLKCEFYDYRKEEMLPLGWQASNIKLTALDIALKEQSNHQQIVAFNIEALLALKSENDRCKWFQRFLAHQWANRIILPITIFTNDVPPDDPKVCNMQDTKLPEQNLVNRLAL